MQNVKCPNSKINNYLKLKITIIELLSGIDVSYYNYAIIIKNIISRSLLSVFFKEFYGFSCCVQVFNTLWVNFCVWCKIVVKFHSFVCGCPVVQYHLLKTWSFLIVHSRLHFYKLTDLLSIEKYCSLSLLMLLDWKTTLFDS